MLKAAALRSAALGRQVGAVAASKDGDILAVGTNEVPRAGGGLYWPDDASDRRDFKLGSDSSDEFKRIVLADIFRRLSEAEWLRPQLADKGIPQLVEDALAGTPDEALARGAHFMQSIEYGRAVHAEMAAITYAARHGISINGCTLFTTTFPCHDCAKHIVAAGIERVVYVEPYSKSLASQLYPDSIVIDRSPSLTPQVSFEPFLGVAPRIYLELFQMPERKERDGTVLNWDPVTSTSRRYEWPLVYLPREKWELNELGEELEGLGLTADTREDDSATTGMAGTAVESSVERRSGMAELDEDGGSNGGTHPP